MSWALGSWKRQVDTFHLTLGYGEGDQEEYDGVVGGGGGGGNGGGGGGLGILKKSGGSPRKQQDVVGAELTAGCKFRIELDWAAGDDEEQVALKLQSQLMVNLPSPHDEVQVSLRVVSKQQHIQTGGGSQSPPNVNNNNSLQIAPNCELHKQEETKQEDEANAVSDDHDHDGVVKVEVGLEVHKRMELLKVVSLSRTVGSGPPGEGLGLLSRVLDPSPTDRTGKITASGELLARMQHHRSLTVLNLSNCFLTVSPPLPAYPTHPSTHPQTLFLILLCIFILFLNPHD
jgi:hypothetical protein